MLEIEERGRRKKKARKGSGWEHCIKLLVFLQEPHTIVEIKRRLNVSERGAYRDIRRIEDAGIVIHRFKVEIEGDVSEKQSIHYCLFESHFKPESIFFMLSDGTVIKKANKGRHAIIAFMRAGQVRKRGKK